MAKALQNTDVYKKETELVRRKKMCEINRSGLGYSRENDRC
jgi:hypothetical protein